MVGMSNLHIAAVCEVVADLRAPSFRAYLLQSTCVPALIVGSRP